MDTKFVLSSNNTKKIEELIQILGFPVLTAKEAGLADVEETETTFKGNALLKARAATQHTGLPAIADDSGLCANGLDGAPGLYSGRLEREKGIEWVINDLKAKKADDWSAYFICVIALVYPDGREYTFEGRMEGRILQTPEYGEKNFGYDPIFIAKGKTVSNAKLRPEEKHVISHRGKALTAMKNFISNA